MTHPTGSYQPGDPVAAARHDGVEAPVRPVLAAGRGLRHRAGLIAVAVVAITVVAAGIGLGGHGFEPAASGGPSGSGTTPGASGRASSNPRSSRGSEGSLDCVLVEVDDLPEPRLWSTAGDATAERGIAGPGDWQLASPPTSAWPVPDEDDAVVIDRLAVVVLVPERRGCIRSATVEYLAATDLGSEPVPLNLGNLEGSLRARLVLGAPPAGDWIFRVVTQYATTTALDDGRAVVERFFRVTAGGGVQPTPLVSPAVACEPIAAADPLPGLSLVAGGQAPVPGIDPQTYPGDILHNGAIVTAGHPDGLVISIDRDACATSWSVEWLDPITGTGITQVVQENPSESPYWASQNRIDIGVGPFGRTVVFATVHFGLRAVRQAAWELTYSPPPAPAGTFLGGPGVAVAGAIACGANWTFADGTGGSEWCNANGMPMTIGLLSVARDQPVRFEIPGWTIGHWNVSCGRRSGESGSEYVFASACDLGYGTGPPVIVLPFPGRTVVLAGVAAERDGITAYVPYVVEVEVLP